MLLGTMSSGTVFWNGTGEDMREPSSSVDE